jgi:hypothetical protein
MCLCKMQHAFIRLETLVILHFVHHFAVDYFLCVLYSPYMIRFIVNYVLPVYIYFQ